MATFNLFPLSRFESGQTSMKRPREFTYFSYDERKQLHTQSSASLRYYYPPFIQAPGTSAPGVSLTDGLQDWIKTDQSVDGHLDALLETIQAHEQRLIEDGATPVGNIRVKADIVSWRGMLTKVKFVHRHANGGKKLIHRSSSDHDSSVRHLQRL